MGRVMSTATPPVARRSRRRPQVITWIILAILTVYALAPLLVFAFNSLKSAREIGSNPLGLPQAWNWDNFATAWEQARMGGALLNSGMIAIATGVGVAIIASMAAYAMTRLDLPGKGGWIVWLLVSSSLPIQLFLVPLVSWWSQLQLYNERIGLVIIYWAVYSPFATLLIRSFLVGVPREFEEAARLDGAGEFRLFFRVVLPMVWPGVLTAGLVAALQAYNEFMLAVTFIQDRAYQPVALSLYSFQQGFTTDWSLVSAAGIIMALPVVILFLLMQRKFIEGYAAGGLAN
ncbi:carbohydrate ABC transporter permease [Microbacterium sp. dk485]|uniref:Carbohydrate ABC transporter permease n=2 Tax=Microbacteriaceae TaxID=85023 RepID=A0ABX5T005_9MICO|nr:carbohydrate ABC transporter permease [Microbacterium wangchenii]TFV84794.1 carbohydrate ABC transporter permease [Microbacterium sp. dk485]TXK11585.1 carbohydrate ABC transporter permease [Microbacterium wangchenii]